MSSTVPLRLKPTLFIFLPCLFALVLVRYTAQADAYLSEDRVYYGADTYTVDYEKKVINAVGHAFFRKETRRVDADRIVIHYEENRKVAYCYGNVVLGDRRDGSRIDGNYAEARFREDFYFIEGDAVYSDEKRRINAQRIESWKEEGYRFLDDVRYNDGTYVITAASLHVNDDTALFRGETHAEHIESKDSIRCDEITYSLSSEDVTFQGRALYIEGAGEKEENTLVIRSDVMRYFRDGDLFVLIGNTFMLNGSYSIRASVVRYRRTGKVLEAEGDVVVWDTDKYVYCNNLDYDVNTDRVVFFKEVKGIFSPPKKAKRDL